jgi:septum formation protein
MREDDMAARFDRLPPLILASASPRRVELLRQLGVEFAVIPAHPEEVQPEHLSPHETAQINAYRKARAVAKHHLDALVLGADTIVCLGPALLGKPATLDEARRMLARLQGRTHEVVTGVCLLHLRSHRQKVFAVSTAVTFRKLHAGQVRRYLSKINPLDKAGAYAIQEEGDEIVKGFHGSFSNVVGLPVERLNEELAAWGGDVEAVNR